MSYQSNQPGTELTPEEQTTLSQLADLGNPGEVPAVNQSGTGLEYKPTFASAGVYVKPTIVDNLNGTITLGNGEYVTYTDDNFTFPLTKQSVASAIYSFTDNTTNYIIYTGATNAITVISDRSVINQSNVIPIVTVYREGNELHILDWDTLAEGLSNKITDRLVRTERFAVETGGLIIGELPTRTITTTAGVVWYGAANVIMGPFTSATDACELWYHSAGDWTKTSITQYNNTQYDNGTTLASIAAGKYAVNWVFRGVELADHAFVVLGTGDYNLSQAQASTIPMLPSIISSQCILVGRIIVKQGDDIATEIASAFDTPFTRTPVTEHNQLANIQGGTANEYYHLTSAQYTDISVAKLPLAGGVMSGDLEIAKANPYFRLKSTDDSNNYAELKRIATYRALTLKNYVATPASDPKAFNMVATSTQYLSSSRIPAIDSGVFNISIYVNFTAGVGGNRTVWCQRNSVANSFYRLLILTTDVLQLQVYNSGYTNINTGTLTTGWHLLTVSVNGVNAVIYIDNQKYTGTLPANFIGTSNYFYIGARNPDEYANFPVDEAHVWSRTLSDAEVQTTLYNGGNGVFGNVANAPFNSGLVAGWHFGEGAGTTVADYIGTFTLTQHGGMAWVVGKISQPASAQLGTALEYFDGVLASEKGILKVGDASGRVVLQGLTHRWNINGVELGKVSSIGVEQTIPSIINGGFDAVQNKIVGYSSQTYDILQVLLYGASNPSLSVSATGSVIVGGAALATNATVGFLYIPTCAGAPTGVPTAKTGRSAMIYDSTNNNFYMYNGAWKKVALA